MARQTKSRKAGKWKKSYKHTQLKKKLDAGVVKKRKNVKSIQRAKEMEEMHRKQKIIEDKYRIQNQQSNCSLELGFDEALSDNAEPEEENAYDTLLSELLPKDRNPASERKNIADSSDEEEEAEEEEQEDEEFEENEEFEEVEEFEEEEDMEHEMTLEEHHEEEADIDESEEDDDEGQEEDDDENDTIDDQESDEGEQADEKESEISATIDEHQAHVDVDDVSANISAGTTADSKVANKLKKVAGKFIMQSLEDAVAPNKHKHHKNDIFSLRLDYELPPEEVEKLLSTDGAKKIMCQHWSSMGQFNFELPLIERPAEQTKQIEQLYTLKGQQNACPFSFKTPKDLETFGVKAALAGYAQLPFTALQTEVFTVLNNYQDLCYPERTLANAVQLRHVYCLHALNHMLKTRGRILHHNAKLTEASVAKSKKAKLDSLVPDSFRDQGLVRPKVLIIVPFRETAYQVVNTMAGLLHGSDCIEGGKTKGNTIMNYERFAGEYTGNELHFAKTNPKPEDYEQTFSGNTDDNFRIGISLTKKCLKLYTDFYSSDILLASPLGLRLIIGAPGSSERDYDFLNSIELLVIDQAELILAQNWENLLHIVEHLHLQPQSLRDADFQRVRPWCLSGLSRFYRQTVLLSSLELPEFRALFSSKCCNYQGKVRVSNPVLTGDIRNVGVPIAQLFRHVDVSDLASAFDQRFSYFIRVVLPHFRAPSFAHCMIYVPSYFDYVRLRNYFKAETISFVQICEYTNKAKIARARDLFFHSGAHFLLYSERSHFYRRTRVKGIRHLIMYQPPVWPHFYSEMINFMHSANQNTRDGLDDSMSITVLYTKYDLLSLKTVLGSAMATKLVQSGQEAHTFAAE